MLGAAHMDQARELGTVEVCGSGVRETKCVGAHGEDEGWRTT